MYLSEARGKKKGRQGKSWGRLGEKRGLDASEVCLNKQADAQGRVDWQGGCSLVARKCRRAVHAPGHRQSARSHVASQEGRLRVQSQSSWSRRAQLSV